MKKLAITLAALMKENEHLKQEIRKLRKEIVRDHLTNLYNPMALASYLTDQVALARRYKLPLSIILIDFDNLKRYNDSYGHLQGNEAIKTAANAMKRSIRDSDLLGRWTSGEEFLVILPDTKKQGALMLAEKMRKLIENSKIKAISDNLKPGYEWITVSIGVAQLDKNLKSMLKQADDALYKAKKLGRNKVIAS